MKLSDNCLGSMLAFAVLLVIVVLALTGCETVPGCPDKSDPWCPKPVATPTVEPTSTKFACPRDGSYLFLGCQP